MKTLLIILCVLIFLGCETEYRTIERVENYCFSDTIPKRADFILRCVENANPRSDEEPEDWLGICQQMAEETYCPSLTVVKRQSIPPGGSYWRDMSITVKGEGNHE